MKRGRVRDSVEEREEGKRGSKGVSKFVNKKKKVAEAEFLVSTTSLSTLSTLSTASLTPASYNYRESIPTTLKALGREARAAPAPGLGVRVVDDLEPGPDQLLLEVDRRAADEVERDRVDGEQRALLFSFFFFITSAFFIDGAFLAEGPVADSGPRVVEREDVGEARAPSGLDGEAEDSSGSFFSFTSRFLLALFEEEVYALDGGRGEAQAVSGR